MKAVSSQLPAVSPVNIWPAAGPVPRLTDAVSPSPKPGIN